MKQLTQKYCLISVLEPVEVNKVFSWKDWVLHVTFAGVHYAEWNNAMMNDFENWIQSIHSFEARTLKIGELGLGEGAADVVFIEKSDSVLHLHTTILDFLNAHNAVFNNPEWNLDGYLPHSTIQKHAQVSENASITIDNVSLVDMFPDGDGYMRKIIKVFDLKK